MAAPRLLGRRPSRPLPPIDRLGPMDRPAGRAAGVQTWRDLLALHWPIPAAELARLVPPSLTLDRFEGETYVSIFCFRAEDSRPSFAPRFLGLAWDEVNVRTYVHRDGKEPGVYFLEADTSSLAAALGMRLLGAVPTDRARIEHRHDAGTLSWECERLSGARFAVECHLGARRGAAEPETLDHFLMERYFLHSTRAGAIWTVRIHHEPLELVNARVHSFEEKLLSELGLTDREGAPHVHHVHEVKAELFLPRVHI